MNTALTGYQMKNLKKSWIRQKNRRSMTKNSLSSVINTGLMMMIISTATTTLALVSMFLLFFTFCVLWGY